MRLSSDSFVLTKSCYWAVSNFLDPWVKVKVKVNVMSLQLLGCRGIIVIIGTLLGVRCYPIWMIFYKPIPNSLIFQTLTSFHRSEPPNDPQFCALPFLKALTSFGLIEHLHLMKNQFTAYPRLLLQKSFLQQNNHCKNNHNQHKQNKENHKQAYHFQIFLIFLNCW